MSLPVPSVPTLPWFTLSPHSLVSLTLSDFVMERLVRDGTLAAAETRGWGPLVSNALVLAYCADALDSALMDTKTRRGSAGIGLRTTCNLVMCGWVALRGLQVRYPHVSLSALIRASLYAKGEDAKYLLVDCDDEAKTDLYEDMFATIYADEQEKILALARDTAWRKLGARRMRNT